MKVKKFFKKTNWQLALCLAAFSPMANAVPFGMFDARTMAMGGVGVASGSKFAVFNNPALLTTADEIHEWYVLAPAISEQFNDPNNVEDSLTAFQQAANTLAGNNTPANQAAVQQQLNALNGNLYGTSSSSAIMITIPSRIISGAAFFNVYEASTAQPIIGGDNLATPSYASTLAQRGLRVTENGIATAKVLDAENGWMRNMAVGFSAKFLLVTGYGYSEALRTADVDIKNTNSKSGSQFAFDVGILKEFGVWKAGLVAKNIVPGNYKYGSSGDAFKIEPQLRAGFAYQSRYSVLELDIDLLENDPVGFNLPSQVAALGWEWQAWKWLAVRAGYNQNLTGNEAAYGAGGIGLTFSALQIDIAAFSGDEGEGVSAQLGLQF
jgi:hypothetical protein